AAVEWLVRRGSLRESVALAGASIGANLALQYLAQDARHRAAILLSPGLDYRGIAAEPLVRRLREGQAVYFVSAEDDGDNAEMVKRLFNAVPLGVAKEIRIFAQGGHGTTMLERDGSISVQLIQWLRRLYY
ncbi:MAG: hypothetical protein Q8R13_01415, partial [bacterium]|nr:hypothetical protein [bacterium]